MPQRYVWSQYNVGYEAAGSNSGSFPNGGGFVFIDIDAADQFWDWNGGSSNRFVDGGPIYVKWGKSYRISNGKFSISSPTSLTFQDGEQETDIELTSGDIHGLDLDIYLTPDDAGGLVEILPAVYIGFSKQNDNSFDVIYYIGITDSRGAARVAISSASRSSNASNIHGVTSTAYVRTSFEAFRFIIGKTGSIIGAVSNSSQSAYPPHDYDSKSANICPYKAPLMRGVGIEPEYWMYPRPGAALAR